MKTQIITLKMDVVNLSREMSRETFRAMPKQKFVGDKRNKPPRFKKDRRDDD